MDLFGQATLLASLAVVVVQQILKLKVIPVTFANKYPVATNIGLSVIAAVVVAWQHQVVAVMAVKDWMQLVAVIVIVAAITYNATIANSGVKKYEG